jgi:hypothetical protein
MPATAKVRHNDHRSVGPSHCPTDEADAHNGLTFGKGLDLAPELPEEIGAFARGCDERLLLRIEQVWIVEIE